jgi:hypothetical protein
MEDVQEVFRKTIEYESQKDLQELVLNRRLLREEVTRPTTGSTPLLVSTKLAIKVRTDWRKERAIA